MNANAKKWVKALKSGEYKKTKGTLRDEKGYCCLGVACELAVQNKIIKPAKKHDESGYFFYGKEDNFLPKKVMQWLGVRSARGSFVAKKEVQLSLDTLNDTGKSFKAIAKIIESEPEGLFV